MTNATPTQRILIADDVQFVREVVSRFLQEAGYEVTTVEDGWEAWRVAQNSLFDLVITDNIMPHLNGTELIKRLRKANPTLPIIMISGFVIDRKPQAVSRQTFTCFTNHLAMTVSWNWSGLCSLTRVPSNAVWEFEGALVPSGTASDYYVGHPETLLGRLDLAAILSS